MGNELDIFKVIWESGPVVKLVLLLLIAASFYSWAVVFKKKKEYKKIQETNESFMKLYGSVDKLKDVLVESREMEFSPFGTMFNYGYDELLKLNEKFTSNGTEKLQDHFSTFGMGVIERALKKGVNESNEKLEQKQSTLASIGSVTPFVGLFGTVWGIINSFNGLAAGGASFEAVIPGIAEALVATAVGLFAAIPAVIFYNYFNNQITTWNSEMDSFGQDFLNMVERSLITQK